MAPTSTPYPFYKPRRYHARTDDQCPPSASTSTCVPLHSADDPYADYISSSSSSSASTRSSRRGRGKDGALLGCLYPGATFVGTQRSGQYAYDVTVTLATVSASASADGSEPHLCGYLKIRGLTDEHPELTTYFDAEVITPSNAPPGPAFRTPRTWGACEARDWQHWTRFPAFQRLELGDLDQRPPVESIVPPITPEYAREAGALTL
ncbi:vacuolar import and degradation protein-domain-containing protein [Auriculariales sp. MPI-PUGE-AT-0066]|nr:vacuolar import and degradation protein-domain-containing protein [Auriculariales sp. MPI-PUGE-AT-0066]